jgi:hypothetical protein
VCWTLRLHVAASFSWSHSVGFPGSKGHRTSYRGKGQTLGLQDASNWGELIRDVAVMYCIGVVTVVAGLLRACE